MNYSVGEVAGFAGISVRTLHHYDRIGLLHASGRTDAGYRRYAHGDLERLQRILCYRELGFSLDDITAILDDPQVDRMEHLHRQHRLLTQRVERYQQMLAAVERMMEARQMEISLTPDEMLEVFGDFDPNEHAVEAEERWGDTDAYQESQRRTSSYTKEDWLGIRTEGQQVEQGLAAAMAAGTPADGREAMDLAEGHRAHISRWFYDCSYEVHRGLGDMYVSDPRFTAHYDDQAPGLAQYVRDAIHANADRAETT